MPKAINPELVSQYLHAIGDRNLFAVPITLEYPQSTEFPNLLNLPVPRYAIGVKVRLAPVLGAAEWGTLIGFYWGYAPHRCQWMYRYIIYLDRDSPSAAWIQSTFTWENEIECQLGETS